MTPADASKRLLPLARGRRLLHGIARHDDSQTPPSPAIAQALHVAPLSMKAVLSSYTLSLAVFIPISGWMADRFGTRRVFASAIGPVQPRLISLRHHLDQQSTSS